jgi:serine/threonine protein phosphatase PrpC
MVALTMSALAANKLELLDWSVAARPLAGQSVCGDSHLVRSIAGGALLAVVDGVGHGEEATAAARTAVQILDRHAGRSIITLFQLCHEALRRTRGVVATLATINRAQGTVTWLGVGNVEGRLLRSEPGASPPSESALLRSGLVGDQLPALQAGVLPIAPGDVLVLATDGIRGAFADSVNLLTGPEQMAQRILARHGKGTDDALVLVARYLGGRHE